MKTIKILLPLFLFSVSVCKAQSWSDLNGGFAIGQYYKVNALCADTIHNVLWAGGRFTETNVGDTVNNISYWDGILWHPFYSHAGVTIVSGFGTSSNTQIKALLIFDSLVVIGSEGGAVCLLNMDDSLITAIGIFNSDVNALCIYNDNLYAGGAFSAYQHPGTGNPWIPMNGIAKWNGTDFVPVGSGVSGGLIDAMCVFNNELIVGGFFENMDGIYCKNVAKWDGTQWSAIGGGIGTMGNFDAHIKSLVSYHGKIYAGGVDINVGSGTDLLWSTGGGWTSVNATFVYVCALKVFQDKLYAGTGTFYTTLPTYWRCEVASFNDTTWHNTGKGPRGGGSNPILTLDIFNDSLFTGGNFIAIGDAPTINSTYARYVARFDPTIIPPIYDNINAPLCFGSSYNFNGQTIIAPGTYSQTNMAESGGDSIITLTLTLAFPSHTNIIDSICQGETYYFHGLPFTNSVTYHDTTINAASCDSVVTLLLTVLPFYPSINISNDTLSASGGSIQWFNCNTQQIISGATQNVFVPTSTGTYAAIITEGNCGDTTVCKSVVTGINQFASSSNQFSVFPNPVSDELIIQLNSPCYNCKIEITNVLGVKVSSFGFGVSGYTITTNLKSFSSGVYFVRVSNEQWSEVRKIIKE